MGVSQPLQTSLHDAHVALGGRMVEFAGYSMPVQYKGVIAEAKAVREGAGMFDVSHMARLTLTGDRVLEFLEWVTTNDVANLTDGNGQYSMLPNAAGGVVDDIIVYRISPTEYRLVVNADNHAKDVAHLKEQNTFGVTMVDTTDESAMIAVQGPKAVSILARLTDRANDLRDAEMFGVVNCKVAGIDVFAARSGYTGEDGYELICAAKDAPELWNGLHVAGVEPCGLGSRDALRVEAGLPLYGHELSDTMSPISAGLGWVISKEKKFLGSEPINAAREAGTPQRLQGVRLNTKRLPQIGMDVLVGEKVVGQVSSGVFSPLLDCGIAFAFVDRKVKVDTPCALDMRGKPEPGMIVNKRFFRRS